MDRSITNIVTADVKEKKSYNLILVQLKKKKLCKVRVKCTSKEPEKQKTKELL
jgi:hypothetical protein